MHASPPKTLLDFEDSVNKKSPWTTPVIPRDGKYFKHSFNIVTTPPVYKSSISDSVTHILGATLLNTDFVPTKK